MIAEIIAIGTELLTPFRQDTNSLYLTGQLSQLGVEVAFKTIVGDDQGRLTLVARAALERSDIMICIGGLGPTADDLTRESVAEALGLSLKRDSKIVGDLYARFAARRIKMPENNLQQADVLDGAEVLANPRGSAPGQYLDGTFEGRRRIVILLPGPPVELRPMWTEQCQPRLEAALPVQHIATKVLRVALMPESECDQRIAPIYRRYKDVLTTILAAPGEVQVHLRAVADSMETAQERVDRLAGKIEDELEERIYSTGGETLEQIVGYYMQMRNATLAVAESCTGGLLAQRITSVPGSSRYFLGGAVVYDNNLKMDFADVPRALLEEHGAVSKPVAIALAEGIRKRCKATLGAAITGIAGPGGGTPEKPVGLVFVSLADGRKTETVERRLPGEREVIRHWATQQALDMVRRKLA